MEINFKVVLGGGEFALDVAIEKSVASYRARPASESLCWQRGAAATWTGPRMDVGDGVAALGVVGVDCLAHCCCGR